MAELVAPLAEPMSWQDRARALAASPAVMRARPAILAALALILVAGLWLATRSPDWRPLYGELSDGDKAAVMAALEAGNYEARLNPDTGSIEVPAGTIAAARILLAGQGLPKSAKALDPVGDMPLGLSRAVEAARLKNAIAVELAASIEAIDGVKRATVHIATPEPSVFVRDKVPASASVFVTLAPGRVLGEAQVRAIIWLVSSSVAGLAAERVSVVDQSGALLSAGTSGSEAEQLGYQVKVEGMVRERLYKLLTPLVGNGRFTAEVAADVDFSQSETASERYGPDAVLRSETASRAIDTAAPPARGIPGALTNTAPQAAQLTATPPATAAPAPPQPGTVTNENTQRAWEIGKDVLVTRGVAPRLKRLSVAVVIDRGETRMTAQDLASLTRIVRGAIGYDERRGDIVEVQQRAFAAPAPEPLVPWYEKPVVQDYAPMVAAAVLLLAGAGAYIWRSRKRAKAEAAAAAPVPVDGGELNPEAEAPPARLVDYSEKLGTTRELVESDADRATAVARQMLATPT